MQPSPPTVPRNPRWRKRCRSGDYRFVRHIPNDGIVCPNHALPQQPLRGHNFPRYDTGDERGATAPLGGQLTQITLPDGAYLTYAWDAAHRLTQVADVQGNRITYTLGAMGNRVQEEVKGSEQYLDPDPATCL